ncbi:MAG: MFS transporter [Oscillospiraceae bacterium]|nr:MFS transporter [Oscillospiraceae bacterium]
MFTILLIIIYLSFISLGLPDSLLGAAWPAMQMSLGLPVSAAGILSITVSAGTVVSSLMSTRLIRKFGTGVLTSVSVAITAISLLGFGLSQSLFVLCLCSIPLGLGAGTVDAALNNFVALHYTARHMNWLHCFWGVGATVGPSIMSFWLAKNNNWSAGYLAIALLQFALVAVLFISVPLWKKVSSLKSAQAGEEDSNAEEIINVPLFRAFKVKNAFAALFAFFFYCSVEATAGLWIGSYAVEKYAVSTETAAVWTSVFFFGITAGRFVSGLAADKLSTKALIRAGEFGIIAGVAVMLLPLPEWKLPLAALVLGVSCAPIFPSMIHRTPQVFGKARSQSMMGMQMAFAYIGTTAMPPLFGLTAEYISISSLPIYMLVCAVFMAICCEYVSRSAGAVSVDK